MTRRFSQAVPVLRWLLEQGKPATITEIAQALGKPRAEVHNTVWRNPALFVKAGEVRQISDGRPAILWSAWEE